MPNLDRACPECNGDGFFGDNGPVVESDCVPCNGTGTIATDALYKLDERVWRGIFDSMQDRRGRDGY